MPLPYAQPEPYTSSRNPRTRKLLLVASALCSILFTLVYIAGIGFLSLVVGGMVGQIYLGLMGLLLLIAVAQSRRLLHRRRVAAVFGVVSHAIRMRLPLPEFLSAAAESERGTLRKRLRSIAHNLRAGHPIERALGESLPELDKRQASLILAAAATGSTAETVNRLSSEHTSQSADPLKSSSATLAYALWTTAILSGVSALIFVFVVPKFGTIIRDFGGSYRDDPFRPLYTLYPFLGIAAAAALLILTNRALTRLFQRRGTSGQSHPPLSPARRHRALADFYHTSADTLQSGQPLESILPWLRGSTQTSKLSSGVAALLESITSGQSLTQAARAAKLPRGDVALLAIARGPLQLATAFRYLAEVCERALSASHERRLALFTLLATAVLALLTIPVVLMIWMPMFQILELVSDQVTHTRY